jgi:hypothetical protein
MKQIGTAALILVWVVFIPHVAGQETKRIAPKKQAPSGQLSQNPSNGEQSSNAAELRAIADTITKYEQETASSQNQETPYEKESIKLQWFLLGIGVTQTVALVGTLLALIYQSSKTAQAARAAQKSVELQEIIQQQWLITEGWRREGQGSREESPPRFTIAMEITNPTDLPVTVKVIKIGIRGSGVTRTVGNKLAPGRSIKSTVGPITVSKEDLPKYMDYRLVVPVSGFVIYDDGFKKEQTQSFAEWCVLGRDNHFASQPIEMSDKDRDEQTKAK